MGKPSLKEQLDAQIAELAPSHGLTVARMTTKPGNVWRVSRGGEYVGSMRYNQAKKLWSSSSPHRGKLTTRGYWGALLEVIEDLAAIHLPGEAPRLTEKPIRVVFSLDEDARKALGRRVGLDRPIDSAEFEVWILNEVAAMVAESLRMMQVEAEAAEEPPPPRPLTINEQMESLGEDRAWL